jgi:hypothetical protein
MDEEAALSRDDEVNLYLATLEARMDPDEFRVLVSLLADTHVLEQDSGDLSHEVPEEDELFLTRGVVEEFMVIMAIISTGRMDQQLVNLGHGVVTVVTEDIATDPAQMRNLRTWAAEHPEGNGGQSNWSM